MLDNFIKKILGHDEQQNTPETPSAPVIMAPVNLRPGEDEGELYYKVSFSTDRGLMREKNEDSYFIDGKYSSVSEQSSGDCFLELSDETHVYGLFDGMGGESFGDRASALAAAALGDISEKLRSSSASDLPFFMNGFARLANNEIIEMLAENGCERGGSTFTAICLKDGSAYPFYLGDSRIYLCDENGLLQITEDQTLAIRNIKSGVYTEEEARNSPDHHKLTCFLGADKAQLGLDAQPCLPVTMRPGVKLLMCSDGLSDMCSREEIAAILAADHENTAQALKDKAIENGGADNVTCIVIEAINGIFNS